MKLPFPRAVVACALLAAAAPACSRDRDPGPDEVTEAEWSAFTPPPDSAITADQVDRYLRTAVAHVELLRRDAPSVDPAAEASAPASGGATGRRRTVQARWSDLVDATFVRAARTEGHSAAEMWYVRDRLAAASGHLLALSMHGSKDGVAALFREQAEAMRGTPGVTEAQIEAMLAAAVQAEEQQPPPVSRAAARNAALLARTKPSVNAEAWGRIAGVTGGGLVGDLATAAPAERERAFAELAALLRGALEDRPPPG
jgi:hypothetical protein